jgi:hypothetical protein
MLTDEHTDRVPDDARAWAGLSERYDERRAHRRELEVSGTVPAA